jgi:hypothetical protein
MGTPLPDEYRKPSGESFLSGTEWEYEDARKVSVHLPLAELRRSDPERVIGVAAGAPI